MTKSRKFYYYRSLPSLKEYITIDSEMALAEGYFKEKKDLWRISSAIGLESKLMIHSIGLEISLADIYAKTRNLKPFPSVCN